MSELPKIGAKLSLDGEKEFKKAISSINMDMKVLGSELSKTASEFSGNKDSVEALTAKNEVFNKQIDKQKEKIEELEKALKHASETYGDSDNRTKQWQISLNKAEGDLNKLNNELNENKSKIEAGADSTKKGAKAIKEFGDNADDTGGKALKLGDIIKANIISDTVISGIKALGGAVKTIGGKLVDMGRDAVGAYGDFEQLTGGIDTLFGSSAETIKRYATDAYKTAGMTANQYMDMTTSFSASLIQSLGGDTKKAADAANIAITDMADNANKMGSDMGSIQQAYQGFAKQNYAMLDNLRIGYGGTKTEMQRLLADAQKFSGVKYDINNLNDVYSAIHVVQTEMGITGTTAKEASLTISGSAAAMKSSWTNMLTELANGSGDMTHEVNNFADSVVTASQNILPRVTQVATQVLPMMSGIIMQLSDVVLEGLSFLLVDVVDSLVDNTPTIAQATKQLIDTVFTLISDNLPMIAQLGMQMVVGLAMQIGQSSVNLIPAIMQTVGIVIKGLLDSLPQILGIGMQMLASLITGLAQQIPMLITQVVSTVVAITTTFLDHLGEVIDAGITILVSLVDGLIQALPKLIAAVPVILGKLISTIMDNLPKIIQTGFQLIFSLLDGLLDALPQLLNQLPAMIDMIATGIIQNLPMIINAGIQLTLRLLDGLLRALPQLLNMLPTIINTITNALINNMPLLISAGIQLTIGLGRGLIQAIPILVRNIPAIIGALFNALRAGFGSFISIGRYLIEGLWQGISGSLSWIRSKIKGWVGNVTSFIKRLFGINSPSRLFRDEIGTNLALGIGVGFEDNMGDVSKAMGKAIPKTFDTAVKVNTMTNIPDINDVQKVNVSRETIYKVNNEEREQENNNLVDRFIDALKNVSVTMDGNRMGKFVQDTVEEVVLA